MDRESGQWYLYFNMCDKWLFKLFPPAIIGESKSEREDHLSEIEMGLAAVKFVS